MKHTDLGQDIHDIENAENLCFMHGWSADDISGIITATFGVYTVLRENGAFIGYTIGGVTGPEAELYRIAVMPEQRGKGFGKRLLSGFTAECASRGAQTVFLEVRSQNSSALSLYRGFGFVEAGKRRAYYGDDDAIIFRYDL